MSESGVAISDDCVNKYQELKLGHSLRYVLFKLSADQTEVVVDSTAPPSTSYQDFVNGLPDNDCRYAVYDYEYDKDGGQRNKILFVVWAPDSAKIKSKMLYASSKDALRRKLVGIGAEIQATDKSELEEAVVLERCTRV